MKLSIVIPTFNECENVVTIQRRIAEAVHHVTDSYEIWFIDDSRDETPQVLENLSQSFANVHYIHRATERGLGTAVVEGFRRAEGEWIVVMDADLQHPPELLPIILERMQEGIDVIIPSRFVSGGSDGGLNLIRKFISWIARSIGRLAIRRLRNVSDCTGGFFGVHRNVIEGSKLNPIGWKILMEVLVKGNYQTVHEIPYAFVSRDAGESKMSIREQWNYLRHIAQMVWDSEEDRRFYMFCFVGALGTIVNLLLMAIFVNVFHLHGFVASVLASIVAMVHNFLWNDKVTWRGFAHPVKWRRALQIPTFVAISAVSIGVTAVFAQWFLWMRMNELWGQALGIIVAIGWSYLANNRFTWSTSSQNSDSAAKRARIIQVTKEEPQA